MLGATPSGADGGNGELDGSAAATGAGVGVGVGVAVWAADGAGLGSAVTASVVGAGGAVGGAVAMGVAGDVSEPITQQLNSTANRSDGRGLVGSVISLRWPCVAQQLPAGSEQSTTRSLYPHSHSGSPHPEIPRATSLMGPHSPTVQGVHSVGARVGGARVGAGVHPVSVCRHTQRPV